MSNNLGEPSEPNDFDTGHQRRLNEFDQRLGAGDFDRGLELSPLTGQKGLEQQRQAFAFAAWAARVSCDPAEDFHGFVECLWQSVETLFQLSERTGGVEDAGLAALPDSIWSDEDPSLVVWGEE